MTSQHILLERDVEKPAVAMVSMNRVDAGNSFDTEMLHQFQGILDEIDRDLSFRVMVLRSNGTHGSYGADVNELVEKKPDGSYGNISYVTAYQHVLDGRKVSIKLFKSRVPTIGLMKGYTLGGGAEFYSMCDVLYGATGPAKEGGLMFGFPETTIGVMAGWMGPEIMAKRIGPARANDLLLTGRMVNAEEALAMGIIQKAFPPDQLEAEGLKWARSVAVNGPLAVESTRRTIYRIGFPGFEEISLNTMHETTGNLLTRDFLAGAQKVLSRKKEPPEYHRV